MFVVFFQAQTYNTVMVTVFILQCEPAILKFVHLKVRFQKASLLVAKKKKKALSVGTKAKWIIIHFQIYLG